MQDDTTTTPETGPSPDNQTASPVPAAQPDMAGAQQPHRGGGVMAVLLILILLGGAGFAAYRLSQPQKPVAGTAVKHEIPLLREGIQASLPNTFYPNIENSSSNFEINRQIFEGLTAITDKSKVVPALATSWTNPDSSTWIFKLRPNVYFHDGHLMTAQLVKASLDSAHDGAYWQTFGGSVVSVSVVDPSTVKITTDGPDPLLTIALANILIFDTTSGKDNDPMNGTGPYILKPGTSVTSDSVKLTAYDKYWAGRPLTREVDFSYVADDAAASAALTAGKVDLANFISNQNVKNLGSAYQSYIGTSPTVTFLIPNTLTPTSPLSKLAVRKAIYSALDPAAIAAIQGENGTPIGQIVTQEIPGYDPSLQRPKIDIASSKQQLAAAGYPQGFSITLSYFQASDPAATEIQKQLAQIGITVVKDKQTNLNNLIGKLSDGKTQLVYISYSSDLLDLNDVASSLVLQTKNYTSSSLASLNSQAATELDAAKRLKLLQQQNQLITNDLAVLPLYQKNNAPLAYRSDSSLVLHQQVTDSISGLYFYQVYSK